MSAIVCLASGCPEHADEPVDECAECAEAFWGRVFRRAFGGQRGKPIILHIEPEMEEP